MTEETWTFLSFLFIAIDCKWKEWGDWGQCKQACPDGSRTRTRTKSQHAQHGGRQCTEDPEEHTTCNRLSQLENEIAQLKETNRLEEEQLHCDVTKCTATAYKTCSGGDLCGTKNGISCAHVPTGLGNTGCAGDPLAPVQGLNHDYPHDNWVMFEGLVEGDQIAGVDISGGCHARLKGKLGTTYFAEVLHPGFTALKGKSEYVMWYDYEELDYVGDTYYLHETNEINLFCPNTNTNTHTDSQTTPTTPSTTYSYDNTPTTSTSQYSDYNY